MGRVILSGASKGMTVPVSYPKNFADATWAQIIEACQQNRVPNSWVVGSQKAMTINGTSYPIDIIGKNHDTYTAGGTAPLTFQLHDCYADTKQMNSTNTNSSGWTSCAMRQTHLPSILALMPTEVQNGIREVNKLTSIGHQGSIINTTADKLFLLSEIEIFGSVNYSKSGEGTQYDYYKTGNGTAKKRDGSGSRWWERSPVSTDNVSFCIVYDGGGIGFSAPYNAYGVAFAFCF